MSRLKIPDQYHSGIASLLSLKDESIHLLISAIQSVPPTLRPKDFIARVASKAPGIDIKVIGQIIGTLVALYQVRSDKGDSIPEFSEEISKAIERSDSKDLKSVNKDPEFLKQRFLKLLVLEKSLGVVSKAIGVLTEHDHVLVDSRILTDFRPIFTNPEEPPAAAVIVHMLKIGYTHNGEYEEFFVAMDTADIKKLRDLLDRADQKAHSLRSVLKKADLPCLEVD